MQTNARWALFGWLGVVVALAAGLQSITGTNPVPVAFLLFPAGFLFVLLGASLRHYFGDPAGSAEAS